MALGRVFGKPGKAGKEQRPAQVPGTPQGRTTPGNAVPAAGFQYGANPISAGLAVRLSVGTSLMSPSVRGRFWPGTSASPANRGGTPDFGALQSFRGAVGKLSRRPRLGAQAGPSSQPAYPSTGQGGILASLGAISSPDTQWLGL